MYKSTVILLLELLILDLVLVIPFHSCLLDLQLCQFLLLHLLFIDELHLFSLHLLPTCPLDHLELRELVHQLLIHLTVNEFFLGIDTIRSEILDFVIVSRCFVL